MKNFILLVLLTVSYISSSITAFPDCCKTNQNAEVCLVFNKLSEDEKTFVTTEGVLDEQCELPHITPEKRKPNFIRYGRSTGGVPTAVDKKAADPNFLRFGRSSDHQNFLRFGRNLGLNEANFLRFGKSSSPDFLRFGKRNAEIKEPNFLRFGKRNNFLRFGRNLIDDQFNREYRKPNFLRFGKRSNSNTNFLRFGRAPTAVLFDDTFDRNYRQQPDFLRFGK
uniref:FMRFamide-related neuropeptides-like n=1 Tax=Parastrongyloides trichosuri TaxID=131310 RepID=A0A0N4ZE91_PARTI